MTAPARTHPTPPHPRRYAAHPLESLIGREQNLVQLEGWVQAGVRLITLSGPGGVGKSRLSLALLERLALRFEQGWFLECAALSSPERLLEALAQHGVREGYEGYEGYEGHAEPGTALERVAAALGARPVLIVLDNLEQIEGRLSALEYLLTCCPNLLLVCTSRSPLWLSGEHLVILEPLGVPAEQASEVELSQSAALQLLTQRLRQWGGEAHRDPERLAELCRRLDGLPLALELAAGCVRSLGLDGLLLRLRDGRGLPGGLGAPRERRHQSLAAVVGWSVELLSPPLQRWFRLLGVFAGRFDLERLEGYARRLALPLEAAQALGALVQASLVVPRPAPDGTMHWQLLETLRQDALERLEASGEAAEASEAHACEYLTFALDRDAHLDSLEQAQVLEALEAALPQCDAALEWLCSAGRWSEATTLAHALWAFWLARGYERSGLRWCERLLPHATQIPERNRGHLHCDLGALLEQVGELLRSKQQMQLGLELLESHGEPSEPLRALNGLIILHWRHARFEQARVLGERCLTLLGSLDGAHGSGVQTRRMGCLINHASTLHLLGHVEEARHHLDEGLRLSRILGQPQAEAHALGLSCDLHLEAGRYAKALEQAQVCLERRLALGLRFESLVSYGTVLVAQVYLGRLDAARETLRPMRQTYRPLSMSSYIPGFLLELAGALLHTGRPTQAARVVACAQRLEQNQGSLWLGRVASHPLFAQLEAQLEGFSTDADWGVEVSGALGTDPALTPPEPAVSPLLPTPARIPPNDLPSPRALEVLRLVAAGHTNKEVARHLCISDHTVRNHLVGIFECLGCKTRTQAVRLALERGWLER